MGPFNRMDSGSCGLECQFVRVDRMCKACEWCLEALGRLGWGAGQVGRGWGGGREAAVHS